MPPKLSPLQHRKGCHADGIWAVAWLKGEVNGDKQLITGSVDETVKRWRVDKEGAVHEEHCYKHDGLELGVVSVATAPNGLMAACSMRSEVMIFDATMFRAQIVAEPGTVWGTAFEPGDAPRHLATAAGAASGVGLWRIDEGRQIKQPVAQYSLQRPAGDHGIAARFTQSVAFSPSGKRVACGSMDGNVAVFDVESKKLLRELEGLSKPVRSLAYMPDGETLLAACDDGFVAMYDAERGDVLEEFQCHSSWVLGVDVHPDGKSFATAGADGTVKLWEVATRTCAQTLTEHKDAVWGVCYSSDGQRVASVSDDRAIAVYAT